MSPGGAQTEPGRNGTDSVDTKHTFCTFPIRRMGETETAVVTRLKSLLVFCQPSASSFGRRAHADRPHCHVSQALTGCAPYHFISEAMIHA